MRLCSTLCAVWGLLMGTAVLNAQPAAPHYEECRLEWIYPIGGQRGTTVKVEITGHSGGLAGARELIIDGPPGITVEELKVVSGNSLIATLQIAPDAPLGRRWLRVLNERSGLTNFLNFVVSSLPERIEVEPNQDVARAESVTLPLVMNGRINPAADLDVFRFSGKRGQNLVAAVAAHALDIHGEGKNYGIADFSLELLDAQGNTLATAEDSLGYDPLIQYVLPADGDYFARVQLVNYQGFPEACYRLTLGAVPYVTGVFPAGFRRGTPTEVELFGPHFPPGTKRLVGQVTSEQMALPLDPTTGTKPVPWLGDQGANWDPGYPLRHTLLDGELSPGIDVPLLRGDLPESLESEPNDDRLTSGLLTLPITVNGRFQQAQDADWYRLRLEAKQQIQCEIVAHRYLKSPIDTLLQVYDAQGQLLSENDDEVFDPNYEQLHDFRTTDSKLAFAAPVAGEYFIKVTDQSGAHGPRAIYRLSVQAERPDFRLTHFPDAAPVWGPGSTACLLVRVDRFAGFTDDVEISVVGLPAGWKTSTATSLRTAPERPTNYYQLRAFLTLTAPADAQPGTTFPLRVVGRAKLSDGTVVERASIPLNLFYTSDTGFFRASPVSRVAVARSQGPWLESVTPALSIQTGGSGSVVVKVHGAGDFKQMPLVVNLATAGVACGLTTPQNLPIIDGQVTVPIKLGPEVPPGVFSIVVAQTWRSDIRIGMPGPCTSAIPLTVLPANPPAK